MRIYDISIVKCSNGVEIQILKNKVSALEDEKTKLQRDSGFNLAEKSKLEAEKIALVLGPA